MKYCLIVSVASLMVVCPCASANKNADPHRHAHSQSHHQEGQTRKTHSAVAGSKQSTSNENAQLAKLERQCPNPLCADEENPETEYFSY